MSFYAIGDLQGCHQQLLALTERIHATSASPKLIFVGDLVNRGPDSLGTLRHIRALGHTANVVLGNHDLHLLAVANGIRKPHASDTLDDILQAPDRDELLDWLRHQSLASFIDGHLIVHAGVLPQWSAQQALNLAHEVETVLRGPDWVGFLREMYGNAPARWDDTLRGPDRLRCIVNAMTRMRYCRADGTMELNSPKGAPPAQPGQLPWFDVPGRKSQDVTVVCGHWSTLGLVMRPNLISLDTGCVWGGQLTAVRLEDRAVLQVDCPQHQRPG
jgi:bis(5'-nucleosyl)-tetraphosphatase (symmetrical)